MFFGVILFSDAA